MCGCRWGKRNTARYIFFVHVSLLALFPHNVYKDDSWISAHVIIVTEGMLLLLTFDNLKCFFLTIMYDIGGMWGTATCGRVTEIFFAERFVCVYGISTVKFPQD